MQEAVTSAGRAARLQGELEHSAMQLRALRERHDGELAAAQLRVNESARKVAVADEVIKASRECLATEQARVLELEVRYGALLA